MKPTEITADRQQAVSQVQQHERKFMGQLEKEGQNTVWHMTSQS